MTQPLHDKVKQLSKAYPVPSQVKLDRRLGRMERMAAFYKQKATDAPPKQAMLFYGFISALLYGITIIRMHRKLTHKLKAIVEEEENVL